MNRIEWSPSPGTATRHRPDRVFDITGIRTCERSPRGSVLSTVPFRPEDRLDIRVVPLHHERA